MASSASSSTLVRTIHLDDARIEAILDMIDNAPRQGDSRRESDRYTYRIKGCVVHLQQPGDASSIPYLVATRNLSAGGLSFLHGGFVHIGSKCMVQLISAHGAWRNITGTVVRCRYARDGLHEVGVRFKDEIEPAEFCPDALRSRVLLVDDEPSVVRLATFLLKQLNADVDHAENGRVGVDMAMANTYDAVLMDMEMPVLDGFGAVKELRAKGYTGVIVAVTAMAQPADKERCLEAGCDKYVTKPLDRQRLADLLNSLKQEPLFSTLQGDPSMAPLIEAFISELPKRLRAIEESFAAEDLAQLEQLTRSLKGDAGGYGFDPITKAAQALEAAMIKKQPPGELKPHLDGLVEWCLQARSSTKAAESADPSGAADAGPTNA